MCMRREAILDEELSMPVQFGDKVKMLSMQTLFVGHHKTASIHQRQTCQLICACHADIGDRIKVLHSKIEDLDLHGEKVDILISEPMGTLLVNERMLETYLYARDHFLKPGGRMFPVRLSLDLASMLL